MRAYFINDETDEHEAIDIEPTLGENYRLIGLQVHGLRGEGD